MEGHLMLTDCTEVAPTVEAVKSALSEGSLLWLDVSAVDGTLLTLLRDDFGLHPLALEDAREFGQRPKAEEFEDFTYLVFFAAAVGEAPTPMPEVHLVYSERFLVTMHHGQVPALDTARQATARTHIRPVPRIAALWRALDSLTDSLYPALSGFDDRIDTLQDQIFTDPSPEQLSDLFGMKRDLVAMRKVVTPERDMLAGIVSGTVTMPGMDDEKERYFRDLYDHLVRASDMIDSYRDLLSGSMDAYTSMVSNKLNVVMKQLTIISTTFLPLTFLTGFFGQNFGWMIARIGGPERFFGIGLGTEAVAVVLLLLLFRKRGWL